MLTLWASMLLAEVRGPELSYNLLLSEKVNASSLLLLLHTHTHTNTGIRPFPYSTNFTIDPQTYGYINQASYSAPTSVHAKGSVWCSILFEGEHGKIRSFLRSPSPNICVCIYLVVTKVYWAVVTKYGFDPDWYNGSGGNNVIFQNVVDGLKLQPCNPSFLVCSTIPLVSKKKKKNKQ